MSRFRMRVIFQNMPNAKLIEIGLICFVTYAVVAIFRMRTVKKIPMTDALKNAE